MEPGGLFVFQGVHEGLLEEEVEEEVGLWTQALLARDELDGWPGLRPVERLREAEHMRATHHASTSLTSGRNPVEGDPLRSGVSHFLIELRGNEGDVFLGRLDAGTSTCTLHISAAL